MTHAPDPEAAPTPPTGEPPRWPAPGAASGSWPWRQARFERTDPAGSGSFLWAQPRDLPTPVPLDEGADLGPLDAARIIAAPDDPADWPAWRRQLERWRSSVLARLGYDGALYLRPEMRWTASMLTTSLAWLWEESLFDRAAGRFTVDRYIDLGVEQFGGYDGVILWHSYPVIGIDDRNQFDFYRDVPELPEVVDQFQRRGVRVFLVYMPWDVGTRREAGTDNDVLLELVRWTCADGVFLDTMGAAQPGLREALDANGPGLSTEGEGQVGLDRLIDQPMSWGQWFADSAVPGVIRNQVLERRHVIHLIRRHHRDHTAELQTAWLNASGVVVWENVFGAWVGWSHRDRAMLRQMVAVQRPWVRHLRDGTWTPLANRPPGSILPVYASRFDLDDTSLWLLVNRADLPARGEVLQVEAPGDIRWFDLLRGTELQPRHTNGTVTVDLPIAGRGLGAIAAFHGGAVTDDRLAGIASVASATGSMADAFLDASYPARSIVRVPAPRAVVTEPPVGFRELGPERRQITISYRQRETGLYASPPFADLWRPLEPLLHGRLTETREIWIGHVAVASRPVTNREFAAFLSATGYRPHRDSRFLAHWADQAPSHEQLEEPVTYVDLGDVRAYAAWAGARLPTEHEWQVADEAGILERPSPIRREWSESEHTDGAIRFVILKGGADFGAEGSDWYLDRGPDEPANAVRLMLASPEVNRSSAMTFRLAVDLP